MRTVAIVHAAQGIIDNGGLAYFFAMDFPQNPPYAMFVDAYHRIGADAVATCIAVGTTLFPFPQPHLHETKRRKWIDSVKGDDAHEFTVLSDTACGNEVAWQRLAEFVDKHRDAFGEAMSRTNFD